MRGMDLHAGLSDEFDPHGEEDTCLPCRSCSAAPNLHHITIIIGSNRKRSYEAGQPISLGYSTRPIARRFSACNAFATSTGANPVTRSAESSYAT